MMDDGSAAALGVLGAQAGADVAVLWKQGGATTEGLVLSAWPAGVAPQGSLWPPVLAPPDPVVAREPARLGALLPTALRLSLPGPARAAMVVDLEDGQFALLLVWCAVEPDRPAEQLLSAQDRSGLGALARRQEHRLRVETQALQLEAAVDILEQGLVVVDDLRMVGYTNGAAARLLGLAAGEVPAAVLADAMQALQNRALNREVLLAAAARLIANPRAVLTDLLWTFAEAPTHLRVNTAPFRGAALSGRAWIFDDVSSLMAALEAENQAQARLRLQHAEVEALNRSLHARVQEGVDALRQKDRMLITQGRQAAMGEMIGNIAHQWRQPLNALGMVLANVRDAQRFGEFEGEPVADLLAKGNRLIQSMSTTISDFQNFFSPDKARVGFSLREQVQKAVALVAASCAAGGVTLRIEGEHDCRLVGFPNEYAQVLVNLLHNARQAIHASGTTPGLVTLRVGETEDWGCLSVRDNGTGIPAEVLDRIFDPYFTTREQGTGLGLHMCRQIIEANMGGRILAENIDGGAEFRVLVPLARA